MEKGLKTLQTTARTAQRKASATSHNSQHSLDERGIPEHNSDSGIGLCSDAEMDVGEDDGEEEAIHQLHHLRYHQQRRIPAPTEIIQPMKTNPSWQLRSSANHQENQQAAIDHSRARSLPQPLPLYQPPPPPVVRHLQAPTYDPTHGHMHIAGMDSNGYASSTASSRRPSMLYPSMAAGYHQQPQQQHPSPRYSPTGSNASSDRNGISIQSVLSGN